MLLRQMMYFCKVVECKSFYQAADELHISQSAISQQIKKLEEELGVRLLIRHNRTFSLSKAGELFYKKSLIIQSQVEQMIQETKKISGKNKPVLSLACYRGYQGSEMDLAVSEFAQKHPDVDIRVVSEGHEQIFHSLLEGSVDFALSDQRRAFSDAFYNQILCESSTYVQISRNHPLARLKQLEIEDLKNLPCILTSSEISRHEEKQYYQEYVGLDCDFEFAGSMQEARLKIITGYGFMPVDVIGEEVWFDAAIAQIPLVRNGKQVRKNYCGFWKKDNSGYYIEEFAEILASKF